MAGILPCRAKSGNYVFVAQGKHTKLLEAPNEAEYLPGEQLVHTENEDAPSIVENDPLAQSAHADGL